MENHYNNFTFKAYSSEKNFETKQLNHLSKENKLTQDKKKLQLKKYAFLISNFVISLGFLIILINFAKMMIIKKNLYFFLIYSLSLVLATTFFYLFAKANKKNRLKKEILIIKKEITENQKKIEKKRKEIEKLEVLTQNNLKKIEIIHKVYQIKSF